MITALKRKMMNKEKKSGFTLIELIIVIAIIAILVMIALPKFAQVKENANVKADVASAKQVQTAALALINDDKITTYNVEMKLTDSGDAEKIKKYMQDGNNVKFKSKKAKGKDVTIKIDDIGDVYIYAGPSTGNIQVYPDSTALTE